jgi:hypothetical protein
MDINRISCASPLPPYRSSLAKPITMAGSAARVRKYDRNDNHAFLPIGDKRAIPCRKQVDMTG